MRIDLPSPKSFKELFNKKINKKVEIEIEGISIDSRNIKKNDLYVAIKGDRVDGNNYIKEAFKSGASAAIVNEIYDKNLGTQYFTKNSMNLISEISSSWRDQFNIPIIGITGSNGKTSTKELLKHILSAKFDMHATEENYNTSISLPLTLLQLSKYHGSSIIEMGANQPGDIQRLCNITNPTHGLITNIAPAHLEGFKNIETIASTKSALFKSLSNGVSFVNAADKRISEIKIEGKKITYGLSSNCDYPADLHYDQSGKLALTIDAHEVKLNSSNLSFAKNVIACCAVSRELGVEWDAIEDRILTFSPPKGRCEVKNNGNFTIIDDTYNANLDSTLAAIDYLNAFTGNGNHIFILGDMLELGNSSADQHQKIAKKCDESNLYAVFTYGKETLSTYSNIKKTNINEHFENKDKLIYAVKEIVKNKDKILVKGSRGMRMETIVKELMNF